MAAEGEILDAIAPYLTLSGTGVPVGAGDDSAVVTLAGLPVVIAADTLVDGIHVDRRWSSWTDLGWKALAVTVSDVAVMAALPRYAVVSLQVPDAVTVAEIRELYEGMAEAAGRWGVAIVGGDTVSSPVLALAVTIIGELVDPGVVIRRSGAGVGDLVVVVGELGLAAAGLAAHQAGRDDLAGMYPEASEAHRRPEPPVRAAEALAIATPTAAIDVSDGLGIDLGRLSVASGIGLDIDGDRLFVAPAVHAIAGALDMDPFELVVGGGDDFALALTIPEDGLARLDSSLEAVGLRGVVIGRTVVGEGVRLRTSGGSRDVTLTGYEHGRSDR